MGRRAIRQRRSTHLRTVWMMPSLGVCRPVYYEAAQVFSEHIANGEWDETISGMAACSVEVIT